MSTLKASFSLIVKHYVSSSIYYEITLEELKHYSCLDPSNYLITKSGWAARRGEFTNSLLYARITNSDVVEILKKVEQYVLPSAEYMEYTLRDMFEHKSNRGWLGIKPGTVRIFSRELMCYYTGKSWKKVQL